MCLQLGRCRYAVLPFGTEVVENMFQCKIVEILKNLPNIFGILDDHLILGYDEDGHDLDTVLR